MGEKKSRIHHIEVIRRLPRHHIVALEADISEPEFQCLFACDIEHDPVCVYAENLTGTSYHAGKLNRNIPSTAA